MTKPTRARFRELDEPECRTLLSRHHVGRIAYTFRDLPAPPPTVQLATTTWQWNALDAASFATLLRNTVQVLLQDHDVWRDASPLVDVLQVIALREVLPKRRAGVLWGHGRRAILDHVQVEE